MAISWTRLVALMKKLYQNVPGTKNGYQHPWSSAKVSFGLTNLWNDSFYSAHSCPSIPIPPKRNGLVQIPDKDNILLLKSGKINAKSNRK